MPSRRTFLLTSAVALASASLPRISHAERVGGEVFTESSLGAYTSGLMTQAHFESVVGTLFMAFLDDNKVAYLRLKSVKSASSDIGETKQASVQAAVTTAVPKAAATTKVKGFSLVFTTGGVEVPQGSYLIDHGTLGRFALFLVAGLDEKGAQACSATFNHIG